MDTKGLKQNYSMFFVPEEVRGNFQAMLQNWVKLKKNTSEFFQQFPQELVSAFNLFKRELDAHVLQIFYEHVSQKCMLKSVASSVH